MIHLVPSVIFLHQIGTYFLFLKSNHKILFLKLCKKNISRATNVIASAAQRLFQTIVLPITLFAVQWDWTTGSTCSDLGLYHPSSLPGRFPVMYRLGRKRGLRHRLDCDCNCAVCHTVMSLLSWWGGRGSLAYLLPLLGSVEANVLWNPSQLPTPIPLIAPSFLWKAKRVVNQFGIGLRL